MCAGNAKCLFNNGPNLVQSLTSFDIKQMAQQFLFWHVNSMPKANQQPDPNRRQTRATNANAHPGNVVMEVLGGRRKQEDIEKEKEAKLERRKARERKNVEQQVAIKNIANFENRMALHDKAEEAMFPRRQTEGNQVLLLWLLCVIVMHPPLVNAPAKPQNKNKKRKVKAEGSEVSGDHDAVSHKKKKSLKAHPRRKLNDGYDTEVDEPEIDQHTKAKKQRTLTGNVGMPLRRTG